MNNALLIVGSTCSALFFIEILRIPQLIKAFLLRHWGRPMHRRLKPFDCPPCLSFWICAVVSTFLGKNPLELLFISVTASILAVFIIKSIEK